MSNSVIQRELTALVHEKKYFHFLRHQRILITCNGAYWIDVYKITYTC